MLEAQQGLLAHPPMALGHAETQEREPGAGAGQDADDTGGFGREGIGVHPVAGHEVGREYDPKQQHAEVAEDADEAGHVGRVGMKFFLDARLDLFSGGVEFGRHMDGLGQQKFETQE